jgi:hypothetical protein
LTGGSYQSIKGWYERFAIQPIGIDTYRCLPTELAQENPEAQTGAEQELDFLPFVNPKLEIFYPIMGMFCPPYLRLES